MAYCALCKKNMGMLIAGFDVPRSQDKFCRDCADVLQAANKAARDKDEKAFDSYCSQIKAYAKSEADAKKYIELYRTVLDKALDEAAKKEEGKNKIQAEQAEMMQYMIAKLKPLADIPVTTTDLKEPYEVLGPVFFNTTNKGVFSSAFTKLCEKYTKEPYSVLVKRPIGESIQTGEFGSFLLSLFDLGGGYEGSVGQWQFDDAYYYSIAELKLRCAEMGGDAIVGMSMDFDLDTNNAAAFYLQMHGTAVKLK